MEKCKQINQKIAYEEPLACQVVLNVLIAYLPRSEEDLGSQLVNLFRSVSCYLNNVYFLVSHRLIPVVLLCIKKNSNIHITDFHCARIKICQVVCSLKNRVY